MLRMIILSVVMFCVTNIAVGQSAMGLELRVIVTAKLDTTATVAGGDVIDGLKLFHPFADKKVIKEQFYVFTQTVSKSYIEETDYYIVPVL